MLYENDNVYPISMTACDDVIDDAIIQILAIKFCNFDSQNRQNRHKFVANSNLKLKQSNESRVYFMMYFQSLQTQKNSK